MFGSSPVSYQDWAKALLNAGASVEVDAVKITKADADVLAKIASSAKNDAKLTLYNCAEIPYDLKAVASIGKGRVAFRL